MLLNNKWKRPFDATDPIIIVNALRQFLNLLLAEIMFMQ